MPVPIEAKRTVSLGAIGREEALRMWGCKTDLATVPATRAPEPICMNWRRDRGFLDIEVFALTSAEVIFCEQTDTQLRKSFTVRNYPTAGGDLVKRFSSAWQRSFRFWACTRKRQPPDGGPDLNHEDRRHESLAREHRCVRRAVIGREFVIGFWWGKVGNPSNRATDAPRATAGCSV